MRVYVFSLLIFFGTLPSYGDLVLQIDPTNNTFAFVGTDMGMPFNNTGQGLTQWNLGVGGDVDVSEFAFDNDLTFGTSVGTPGNTNQGYDFFLTTGGGATSDIITFTFGTSSPEMQTFTGLGNFQSYTGLTETDRAIFESTIGGTFSLVQGTGFSSIDVVGVPEPSSFLFLSVLGLGIATVPRVVRFIRRSSTAS